MDIELILGDITKIKGVDCIVNAANTSLLGGGGVDGAIHRNGGRAILDDCLKIRAKQGGCKVGEAVITTAGNLFAKYVIHVVGPKWVNGLMRENEFLQEAYINSLILAEENKIESIAFPNISTGTYGFPKVNAAKIAIEAISNYKKRNLSIRKIFFVCHDLENYKIYERLLGEDC